MTNFLAQFLPALAANGDEGFWLPEQASSVAGTVDDAYYFILGVSIFFTVLIVGVTAWFLIKYRARPGHKPQKSASHSTALELTWSIIPAILVVMMFFYGFRGMMEMYTPLAEPYEILVTGQKWNWQFTYPNGHIDSELHVEEGQNVRLVMTSQDVIHSVFIPAFRIKRDTVPGRYTKVWFKPTRPGEYALYCTEYCGTSHSDMNSTVTVHPPGEFEIWLEKASDPFNDDQGNPVPLDQVGELLYNKRGCTQCHTIDGSARIGPSFLGLWGANRQFTDGSSMTADENYIRSSIVNPQGQVVAGYDGVMPSYQGMLKDKEITAIIEYIKSLP